LGEESTWAGCAIAEKSFVLDHQFTWQGTLALISPASAYFLLTNRRRLLLAFPIVTFERAAGHDQIKGKCLFDHERDFLLLACINCFSARRAGRIGCVAALKAASEVERSGTERLSGFMRA
jgi:hypothetical protein